ncbi:MAG TPA: glycogen debranching N-terminal domain-containing protein [Gemmatimonadaceae bacterium]
MARSVLSRYAMAHIVIRPSQRYAWHGQSLLVTGVDGTCGTHESLSGFYFRETRVVSTLRFTLNGESPWLCESGDPQPQSLEFQYAYPELEHFGGGGSGYSDETQSTNREGIPHRAIDIVLRYDVGIAGLRASIRLTNRSPVAVDLEFAWIAGADFADIQEALGGERQQNAAVASTIHPTRLTFRYQHTALPFEVALVPLEPDGWLLTDGMLTRHVRLERQAAFNAMLDVQPRDYDDMPSAAELRDAERRWDEWHATFVAIRAPRSEIIERTINANIRDLASYPLFRGERDEWLAPQAGMPLYPALFGRDAFTTGWQATFVDNGAMLDASLTRLGRLQSTRVDDWHDEEPGRIPYQMRSGPLARLGVNPYSAYYADYASPLMFIIGLAHLYAWTGDRAVVAKHWDTARRILDWARDYGDPDGDGYLEYDTRSSVGTKNQGWKDSGNAILYEDGTPVPSPLGTCELQGYWFAAQRIMAALSWMMDEHDTARAYWRSSTQLKERFNRDWWMDDLQFVAVARDSNKQLVRMVTSNVGHCIATGIVDDEHLPMVVGRLFAPDMFSGWGVRTLSTRDPSYNPIDYHLGTVWAVENASIVFGLRRFGFDQRALDLSKSLFDLAALYPDYRIPECVGGYARSERSSPGAYPRANTPQLWNASVFPMLLQAILGLQPVAPLSLLVVDPILPEWLPEITIERLRVGKATATIHFWRAADGTSHAEIVHKNGSLHLLRQPPIEARDTRTWDRLSALIETVIHH